MCSDLLFVYSSSQPHPESHIRFSSQFEFTLTVSNLTDKYANTPVDYHNKIYLTKSTVFFFLRGKQTLNTGIVLQEEL